MWGLAPEIAREGPAGLQQYARRTLFDDTSSLKNQNMIRIFDGCEPMRDNNHRPVLGISDQSALKGPLGRCVERICCFVQDQDVRIPKERARQREALALPSGKLRPPFANDRVITLRQHPNELIGARELSRSGDICFRR
jgi:hypothetical protein